MYDNNDLDWSMEAINGEFVGELKITLLKI